MVNILKSIFKMKHRFKESALLQIILLGVLICYSSTAFARETEKPNIIILLADDLGYRDLSCYGSTQVYTPNIDKLATEGMRFTDFYAGSAVCSPSRAALLTGRSSVRAGIYSWIHPSQKMHLHSDEVTIAEVLKEQGYVTAHIGKWHLGYDLEEGSGPGPDPGDQGFDYWIATGNNARPSHHNPDNFVRNGKAIGVIEGYSSQIVVENAIKWLDEKRDPSSPYFLNLWFHEPHAPVAAPDELTERHSQTAKPAYYGSIENMDNAIGKLLDRLEQTGQSENTIVFFMSDNGSYMGKYGSNGEFKSGKTKLWEGGIRVPGIVRWPGVVEPGKIERKPAGVVDILPTICGITDTDLPADREIDGTSLVPLYKGNSFTRRKPLYWFYSPSRPVVVIRDGDWSLIADPELDIPKDNLFEEEWIGMIKETRLKNFRLYNLRRDPGQGGESVTDDYPKVFDSMKADLIALHNEIVKEAIDWRTFTW